MNLMAHLFWVLVFDDQQDHLDKHYLPVFLDIVQRVQKWLGLRQSGDPDDQHLKQDIRSIGEDLKDKQSPRHEDGTKPDAKIMKKQVKKRVLGVEPYVCQTV